MQSLVFENQVKLSLILVYFSTEFPLAWEPTGQKRQKRFQFCIQQFSHASQAFTREGADVNPIQDLM